MSMKRWRRLMHCTDSDVLWDDALATLVIKNEKLRFYNFLGGLLCLPHALFLDLVRYVVMPLDRSCSR